MSKPLRKSRIVWITYDDLDDYGYLIHRTKPERYRGAWGMHWTSDCFKAMSTASFESLFGTKWRDLDKPMKVRLEELA